MEQVDHLYGEIQRIVNELVSTPDDKAGLQEKQKLLRSIWEKYRVAVAELRTELSDSDDIAALDEQTTRALKSFNVADQGITNKLAKQIEREAELEKLRKDVKPLLQTPTVGPSDVKQETQATQTMPTTSSTEEKGESKPPGEVTEPPPVRRRGTRSIF